MKKVLFMFAAVAAMTLVSCGDKAKQNKEAEEAPAVEEVAAPAEEAAEETEAPAEEAAEEAEAPAEEAAQ